jgi:hypothetical protein
MAAAGGHLPVTVPTVGQRVHYVSYGTPGGEYPSTCRAAVVTDVANEPDGTISLAVLNPTGMFFDLDVAHDVRKRPGTWHWPDHV